jgi:hypothetical protein
MVYVPKSIGSSYGFYDEKNLYDPDGMAQPPEEDKIRVRFQQRRQVFLGEA